MPYRVIIAPKAERQMVKLSKEVLDRLDPKILARAETPRPQGVEKLTNEERLYRVRVGDYRIVYEIRDDAGLVKVTKVGHRREVYR